jgi:hypothetical protein
MEWKDLPSAIRWHFGRLVPRTRTIRGTNEYEVRFRRDDGREDFRRVRLLGIDVTMRLILGAKGEDPFAVAVSDIVTIWRVRRRYPW